MNYRAILTMEPGKRGGQPCIRGMSIDEILDDFPYLRRTDVLASLSYAADRERRTFVAAEQGIVPRIG